MKAKTGEEIKELTDNVIHEGTQVREKAVDLTAGTIYNLSGKGAVDFGGSEHVIRPRAQLSPKKKDGDDKYGWWHLTAGTYVVELNESFDLGGKVGMVIPHPRLLNSGAYHVNRVVTGNMAVIELHLLVGPQGIDIKENARISSLIVFE